jgi:hypothetical protein
MFAENPIVVDSDSFDCSMKYLPFSVVAHLIHSFHGRRRLVMMISQILYNRKRQHRNDEIPSDDHIRRLRAFSSSFHQPRFLVRELPAPMIAEGAVGAIHAVMLEVGLDELEWGHGSFISTMRYSIV